MIPAKSSKEIEVRKIRLERKLNPDKGWSEWFVGGKYYPHVEDAALEYLISESGFGGLRTPYRLWKEAFGGIKNNRIKQRANKIDEALRSFDPLKLKAIKELIDSTSRRGAPDLLVIQGENIQFVEVKVSDSLSNEQKNWLNGLMDSGIDAYLIRVKPEHNGKQMTRDEYIISAIEEQMLNYIKDTAHPNPVDAFASAKRSLTGFNGYSLDSTVEFESRIHKLFAGNKIEKSYHRLIKNRLGE